MRELCFSCFLFGRALSGKLALMGVLFANPLSAFAEERYMDWQGETPPASGVPSAQWFFDPDSWVGGIYPGNSALPPGVQLDIARYRFHPTVTPKDNTWIVQFGTAGPHLPASHKSALVYPGNWVFKFEQPGAPGAPPIPIGSYTLTGYPGGALIVGNTAGVTNLMIEGHPSNRDNENLITNGTTIAVLGGSVTNVTLLNAFWREDLGILLGSGGRGILSVVGGGRLVADDISFSTHAPGAHGSLTISDGGQVESIISRIAFLAGTTGDALITGEDSEWINTGGMDVGRDGNGTLRVLDGAQLSSTWVSIGKHVASTGTVVIENQGHGYSGPRARVNVADTLYVGGDALQTGGNAMLEVKSGGVATVGRQLHISAQGTVQIDSFDARLVVGPGPFHNGTEEGVVEVYKNGTLSGNGLVVADVLNHGVVAPGNSPGALTIDGSYGQSTTGELSIELASTSNFDRLLVVGDVSLGGALEVSVLDGFTPQRGDSFDILDWGSVAGKFSMLALPTLTGNLGWSISRLYTEGVLSVTMAGDFDGDDDVDGSDFLVWQRNPGVGNLANWRANYGMRGSSAPSNAVPEPASCVLLLSSIVVGAWTRPRNRPACPRARGHHAFVRRRRRNAMVG